MKNIVTAGLVLMAALFVMIFSFMWIFCRIQVEPGYMAIVTAKVGKDLPPNEILAAPGEKGVQRDPLPEGRHFLNPINYSWVVVPVVNIPVGKVGVVTAKVGKELPQGEILSADETGKGIWKDVLGPGTYRLNTQGYEVTQLDAMNIPIGYVGVVTSQTGRSVPLGQFAGPGQQGVMQDVLQPGLYYINPRAYQVDILEIGMNQVSILGRSGSVVITKSQISSENGGELQSLQMNAMRAQQAKRNEYLEKNKDSGFVANQAFQTDQQMESKPKSSLSSNRGRNAQPPAQARPNAAQQGVDPFANQQVQQTVIPESAAFGISRFVEFPSRDGFQILLDMTVEFELLPENISRIYMLYGDLPAVVEKILLPQILSISRIKGSSYKARDFIDGEGRQLFQNELTTELVRVLKEKHILIHNAIIRHVEVPNDILTPIQSASVAKEQDLTNKARQDTARKQAELNTETAMVEQLKKQVDQETEMLVATTAAKTKNEVASINASATLKAAELNLLKAAIQAQITQVQGEAKVQAGFVVDNERALGDKLRVSVFKDSSTLADLTFVDKLNEGLSIKILHAGTGTLWTDMKGLTPTVPVKTAK
jgi:multidrug efflux pump subunit AcrA (membrane-fusion protein)